MEYLTDLSCYGGVILDRLGNINTIVLEKNVTFNSSDLIAFNRSTGWGLNVLSSVVD